MIIKELFSDSISGDSVSIYLFNGSNCVDSSYTKRLFSDFEVPELKDYFLFCMKGQFFYIN